MDPNTNAKPNIARAPEPLAATAGRAIDELYTIEHELNRLDASLLATGHYDDAQGVPVPRPPDLETMLERIVGGLKGCRQTIERLNARVGLDNVTVLAGGAGLGAGGGSNRGR